MFSKWALGVKTRYKSIRENKLYLLFICIVVAIILIASVLTAMSFGSSKLDASTALDVIAFKMFAHKSVDISLSKINIIWNLRLPRALLALIAGGGLAICGAAMQAITQNELADPYVLGVSGGASAAASFAIFLGGIFASNAMIQLFSILGAIAALIIVYAIGVRGVGAPETRLVLIGMAVSIIAQAASQFFITLAPSDVSRNILMWLMGSMSSARWDNIFVPLVVSLCGLGYFVLCARDYDLNSLGSETAIALGVNTNQLLKRTIFIVAIVCGVIVSICGIIGLVGFIIPHIVRLLIGAKHRKLFIFSFILGGVFLVWMDLLARTLLAPQEMPVGIFTALCGGPFFVWLLYRKNKKA